MLGKCVQNLGAIIDRYKLAVLSLFLVSFSASFPAMAQNISDVADNVATSASGLPGLVSALAYALGLVFGVRGVLKLKAHVENPGNGAGQTPLRTPMISLFIGGALFALPIIYDAAQTAIEGAGGGVNPLLGFVGRFLSTPLTGAAAANSFNVILENIIESINDLPGLITAFGYMFGIVIIVMGLIKIKDHVETPEQVKVSEGVIRLLIGGALLTLPVIYNAMFNTLDGANGGSSLAAGLAATIGLTDSTFIDGAATCVQGTGSFGQLICSLTANTGLLPAFFAAVSYLFGLVMGIWGVMKIRDHVLNPQQTSVFEGISRLIAGGAFFALPFLVTVLANTFDNGGVAGGITGYNFGGAVAGWVAAIVGGGTCPVGGLSLDGMLVCLITDILGPIHAIVSFFAFVAGMVFIMIGTSRLIKGAQEGAKAPGGLGTIMTFGIGGALISYNDIMRAASATFTGSSTTTTFATMNYTTGMTGAEVDAAHAVVSSIIKFMIIVGIISFVRGLFIVRSVAEGNQQASMMAGVTHLVGGALAVNLGPVLNAVQATLGTTGFGITFT